MEGEKLPHLVRYQPVTPSVAHTPAEKHKNKPGTYHRITCKEAPEDHHASVLRTVLFQHTIYLAQVMNACRSFITSESDLEP
jgi:hypothetical protein